MSGILSRRVAGDRWLSDTVAAMKFGQSFDV